MKKLAIVVGVKDLRHCLGIQAKTPGHGPPINLASHQGGGKNAVIWVNATWLLPVSGTLHGPHGHNLISMTDRILKSDSADRLPLKQLRSMSEPEVRT